MSNTPNRWRAIASLLLLAAVVAVGVALWLKHRELPAPRLARLLDNDVEGAERDLRAARAMDPESMVTRMIDRMLRPFEAVREQAASDRAGK
jgi:hypothetical protein